MITLVDCLYDSGKRLVCTAETSAEQLFSGSIAAASDLVDNDTRL